MNFLNSSVSFAAILPRCILVAAAIAFLPLAAFAKQFSYMPLPASPYADTEVSTNIAFNCNRREIKALEIEFKMECSPSNNIQIAFGTDSDSDGNLSFQETEAVYGWRNGRYFAEDVISGARQEYLENFPSIGFDWSKWDLVRITRRGSGVPDEWIFCNVEYASLVFFVR